MHDTSAPDATGHGRARYVCPRCGASASGGGRCADDGAELLVASAPPPSVLERADRIAEVDGRRRFEAFGAWVPLAVGGMVALETAGAWRLLGVPFLVLGVLMMVWHGRLAVGNRALRERQPPLERVAIAAARPGPVRVCGRVRNLSGTEDSDGLGRVVFAAADELGRGVARGVAFELVDASGARAVVRAEYVSLPSEFRRGERYVVPADTELELVGVARWCDGNPDGRGASYREMDRALEIAAPDGGVATLACAPAFTDAATRHTDDWRAAAHGQPAGVRVDAGVADGVRVAEGRARDGADEATGQGAAPGASQRATRS